MRTDRRTAAREAGGQKTSSRSSTAVSPSARRTFLERAATVLASIARHTSLVKSYARMNPAAKIRANAFYFGEPDAPPRIVIFGPWAYVHAPGVKLPPDVEELTESYRASKHLGALHARVRIDSESALEVLRRTAERLRRTADW